jgi:cytochrome P450
MVSASAEQLDSELDPFLDQHLAEPYALYEKLRAQPEAVYLPERDVWLVSRYDSVQEVLRRHKDFVSGLGVSYVRVADSGYRFPFIDNDPPEHTRVRRAAQPSFTPSAVDQLTPAVRDIIEELLAPISGEPVEIVRALSSRISDLTLQQVTGIIPPSPEKIAAWADAVLHVVGPDPAEDAWTLVGECFEWLTSEGLPGLPGHCLGRLIMDEGGHTGGLNAEGAERMLALASIWLAGIDTTNSLIANALHAFAVYPDQWELLRQDPSRVTNAVEEVLRWDSPFRIFFRRTVAETTLGEVTIPADANVCAMFGAANRDPDRFADPDRFDVLRQDAGQHLAFGASVHKCIGAPVARMEAVELITALVHRVERIEIAGTPVRNPNRVVRNFSKLPLRLVAAQ